jgi:heme-degrading monooxygenase HmoA
MSFKRHFILEDIIMYIVNFIKSTNVEIAKQKWYFISNNFIGKAGIISTNFYEVTGQSKSENPLSYQLVSVIECEKREDYEKAKQEICSELEIKKIYEGEDDRLVMGKETFGETLYNRGTLQLDTPHILLINPFKIKSSQIESWYNIWYGASQQIEKKEGFIGVNFIKAVDAEVSEIKYINIAEWRSQEDMKNAISKEDYVKHRKIARDYPMEPSFCIHVSTEKPQSDFTNKF